jgi:DNA polymerase elongation subunit (family B)
MKMNVPLFVKGEIIDGEQFLKIFRNGTIEHQEPPVQPFFYTSFDIETAPEVIRNLFIKPNTTKVKVRPMNKRNPEEWFLHEFQNEIGMKYISKVVRESGTRTDPEAHLILDWLGRSSLKVSGLGNRYTDQVLTTNPDWFRQFACDSGLKVMILDIEQHAKGESFEITRKNPLISIGFELLHNERHEVHYYGADAPAEGYSVADRDILQSFVTVFKEFDPDIIVGYNVCGYDLPTLCYRLGMNGFSTKFFDREKREDPFFMKKKLSTQTIDVCTIPGRIVFDVMHSVLLDQTLNGQVKNRKLKTIAKYYQKKGNIPADVEIIEEGMRDNTALIGTPKLKRYNLSDVSITRYLFEMYVKNNIAVAEFIGCPLNQVVPMASSYPFSVVCSQIFHKAGIISPGKNVERNSKLFSTGGKPFEAADVACFQTGRFENIVEYDVGSLYPSIMVSLGLGPDNTRVVRTEPFKYKKEGERSVLDIPEFSVIRVGKTKTFFVPDRIRNWTWVIEVNGVSPVAEKVKELLFERMRIKKVSGLLEKYLEYLVDGKDTTKLEEQMRKLNLGHLIGDKHATAAAQWEAYVRAYGLKVVLNSLYGMMGSKMAEYGELGVAALITGVGRQILGLGVEFLEEKNCILEDTDGIKSTRHVNVDDMNKFVDDYVINVLGGEPVIKYESKVYPVIFSKAMKTYLMLNAKGEMDIHGVGFKSSRAPALFDKIVNELGMEMLKHGHEKMRGRAAAYHSLERIPMADFIQSVRTNKPLDSYAEGNMARKLAAVYEEKLGIAPGIGVSYEYIKTKQGYEPPTEDAWRRLDKHHYEKLVGKAIESLGFKNVFNKTLMEFGA